ncbi:hypothetical protein [Roseateles toxinivorans]|uniref:Uncharacterized protein n=1 Tax=Roseateles toxinivorans TaxID=270368 RepID=A0A4R6QF33_9BURK|nr:hypothetical protein [Roseateles toxinivorans]TDP60616.1 hypothetical protein DES47_11537 [Roseateles toxinivorans]
MKLVTAFLAGLASYVQTLQRGWSADNARGALAGQEEWKKIANNAGDPGPAD